MLELKKLFYDCKSLICCLFCVLLLVPTAMTINATPAETTVRVGYAQLQGFLYKQDNGDYGGLGYDLLQEIAVHNNWKYEFVPCAYAESEKCLNDGLIDIFIPYQKTPEREKIYEYSRNIFCTNKASLLALPSSELYYDDFEHMHDITIGVPKNTRNSQRFVDFLEGKGCHVTMKADYENQSELIKAVKAGEIDAFISASNRGITDCKIISVLPETNSYVIAKKGNREILDKVDKAIDHVNVSMPNLISTLDKKYQIPENGTYPSLTRGEAEYVQNKKTVTVLVNGEECDKEGKFTGSAKDLFSQLSNITGLEFEPKIETDIGVILDDFKNGKADIMYSFNHDYKWAENHNAWLTETYAEFYNKVITKRETQTINTVAVVPGSFIEYYVTNKLGYKTVEAKSYKEGISMVKNGKVDATYCNSPIGNYYSTFPEFRSLSFISAYDFNSAYCMAVSKSSDNTLVDILNKSIICIPKSSMSKSFEQQMNSRPITLTDALYDDPIAFTAACFVVALVLFAFVFLLFYVNTIRKKNQQLAIANSAKTDFLARMSHDMRTPMNGILGLTTLTKDENDIETVHKNLNQIELSGKFLLSLINDTLDMNKIESGKLELRTKPINSESVFKNVLANASILAESKGVNLKLEIPQIPHNKWVPVVADASRVEQILMNIISNAVKFTSAGGTVTLHMDSLYIGEDTVKDRYIISDTGIGMSKEFLPRLFEPFSQEGRLNTAREEGTGLGMPIVKQLVDLMGGTIEVESELNKGTKITVVLEYPVYKGKLETEDDRAVDYSQLKGKRILLCEDNELNAKIAIKLLEKKDILVERAENGKIGLEMFEKATPNYYDGVLMDVRMPVMNGLESAKAIRNLNREDAKSIPIIAMTANAFDDDIQNCINAGMNAHLSKPIATRIMYDTIAKYLCK